MTYIGCDPGVSGGITVLSTQGVDVVSMPPTEKQVWGFIEMWSDVEGGIVCVLERVHSMPRDGVASSFKFGTSYGGLRMSLIAAGIPFVNVEPRVWQKYFGLLKLNKDEGDSAHKTRIGSYAKIRYPDVKIPRPAYDSVFLALYAKLCYPKGL